MSRRDNYRTRMGLRRAWRTGAEDDGTQALPANADAADMSEAGWIFVGVTRSTNAEIAANGAFDAASFTEDSGNTRHMTYVDPSPSDVINPAGTHTLSIYFRRRFGQRRYGALQALNNAGTVSSVIWFDALLGLVTALDGSTVEAAFIRPARFGMFKLTMWCNRGTIRYYVFGLSQHADPASSPSETAGFPVYTGDSASSILGWRPKATASEYRGN